MQERSSRSSLSSLEGVRDSSKYKRYAAKNFAKVEVHKYKISAGHRILESHKVAGKRF